MQKAKIRAQQNEPLFSKQSLGMTHAPSNGISTKTMPEIYSTTEKAVNNSLDFYVEDPSS